MAKKKGPNLAKKSSQKSKPRNGPTIGADFEVGGHEGSVEAGLGSVGASLEIASSDTTTLELTAELDIAPVDIDIDYDSATNSLGGSVEAGLPLDLASVAVGLTVDLDTGAIEAVEVGVGAAGFAMSVEVGFDPNGEPCRSTVSYSLFGIGFAMTEDRCDGIEYEDEEQVEDGEEVDEDSRLEREAKKDIENAFDDDYLAGLDAGCFVYIFIGPHDSFFSKDPLPDTDVNSFNKGLDEDWPLSAGNYETMDIHPYWERLMEGSISSPSTYRDTATSLIWRSGLYRTKYKEPHVEGADYEWTSFFADRQPYKIPHMAHYFDGPITYINGIGIAHFQRPTEIVMIQNGFTDPWPAVVKADRGFVIRTPPLPSYLSFIKSALSRVEFLNSTVSLKRLAGTSGFNDSNAPPAPKFSSWSIDVKVKCGDRVFTPPPKRGRHKPRFRPIPFRKKPENIMSDNCCLATLQLVTGLVNNLGLDEVYQWPKNVEIEEGEIVPAYSLSHYISMQPNLAKVVGYPNGKKQAWPKKVLIQPSVTTKSPKEEEAVNIAEILDMMGNSVGYRKQPMVVTLQLKNDKRTFTYRSLGDLVDDLTKVIAPHKFLYANDNKGFAIPAEQLFPGAEDYDVTKDVAGVLSRMGAIVQRYGCDGPIWIETRPPDPKIKGDKGDGFEIKNLAGGIQFLVKSNVETMEDVNALVNLEIRGNYLNSRIYQLLVRVWYRITAILDGLGVKTQHDTVEIPCEVNPLAGVKLKKGFNTKDDDLDLTPSPENLDFGDDDTTEKILEKFMQTSKLPQKVDKFNKKGPSIFKLLFKR